MRAADTLMTAAVAFVLAGCCSSNSTASSSGGVSNPRTDETVNPVKAPAAQPSADCFSGLYKRGSDQTEPSDDPTSSAGCFQVVDPSIQTGSQAHATAGILELSPIPMLEENGSEGLNCYRRDDNKFILQSCPPMGMKGMFLARGTFIRWLRTYSTPTNSAWFRRTDGTIGIWASFGYEGENICLNETEAGLEGWRIHVSDSGPASSREVIKLRRIPCEGSQP